MNKTFFFHPAHDVKRKLLALKGGGKTNLRRLLSVIQSGTQVAAKDSICAKNEKQQFCTVPGSK